MNTYPILPANIVVNGVTYVATFITMYVTYNLNATDMLVPYNLVGDNGKTYWASTVDIDQNELANWGTDNMYIVDLVCQKAGVTLL